MVNGIDWRAEARRYAVPVLILLAATIGGLLVRGALADDREATAQKPAAQGTTRRGVKRAAAKLHIVSSGDTLGAIAERYETTVARLRALNPTADPRALRVGQELRVPTGDG
jgi:LysM repeat protein